VADHALSTEVPVNGKPTHSSEPAAWKKRRPAPSLAAWQPANSSALSSCRCRCQSGRCRSQRRIPQPDRCKVQVCESTLLVLQLWFATSPVVLIQATGPRSAGIGSFELTANSFRRGTKFRMNFARFLSVAIVLLYAAVAPASAATASMWLRGTIDDVSSFDAYNPSNPSPDPFFPFVAGQEFYASLTYRTDVRAAPDGWNGVSPDFPADYPYYSENGLTISTETGRFLAPSGMVSINDTGVSYSPFFSRGYPIWWVGLHAIWPIGYFERLGANELAISDIVTGSILGRMEFSPGKYSSFSGTINAVALPIPAAGWLFVSALFGAIGIKRFGTQVKTTTSA
jgi:hypothetical protein